MTDHRYNPNKNGKANVPHKNLKYYLPNGDYLLYGNGCKFSPDCFTCGLSDCLWDECNHSNEATLTRREQCTT